MPLVYTCCRHRAALVNASPLSPSLQVHPDWAPLGVARFSELLEQNFFKVRDGEGEEGVVLVYISCPPSRAALKA